jgi:hypothetical protein
MITPKLTADEIFTNKILPNSGQDIVIDASGSAIFTGGITADWIKANRIEGMEILAAKYSGLERQVASLSGLIADTPTPTIFLPSPTMTPVPSLDMTVLGEMVLKKGLTVDGQASFTGDVVFERAITFRSPPLFGKDTAGEAVIKTGSDRVDIVFDIDYISPPIVTINLSLNGLKKADGTADADADNELEKKIFSRNYAYIVTKKTIKGFTIVLNKTANEDLTFSWTALGVKDANTFISSQPVTIPEVLGTKTTETVISASPSGQKTGEEASVSAAINN